MLKTKYVYPAIFERDPESGFGVSIPDLHAYADGDDFEEALENATLAGGTALRRLISRGATIPEPSSTTEFELNPNERICSLELYVFERRSEDQASTSLSCFNEGAENVVDFSPTFSTQAKENFAFR